MEVRDRDITVYDTEKERKRIELCLTCPFDKCKNCFARYAREWHKLRMQKEKEANEKW